MIHSFAAHPQRREVNMELICETRAVGFEIGIIKQLAGYFLQMVDEDQTH